MNKKVSFNIKSADWNVFKRNCKLQGTNASTELRKFIKIYNKYYKEHKKDINPDIFSQFAD